jgi:large subunit ribosomal protein L25
VRALDLLVISGGRTSLIAITVDGHTETALLKTLQRDPRSAQIIHADFQAVSMEEEVTSVVPIRFVGESEAVTKLDGVMTHPRTELHVTARAADLPDAVEVDLSALADLHAAIHISDLPDAGTYRIVDPPEEVLAIVLPPKREVEEVVEEAAAEAVPPAAAEAAEPAADAAGEAAPSDSASSD